MMIQSLRKNPTIMIVRLQVVRIVGSSVGLLFIVTGVLNVSPPSVLFDINTSLLSIDSTSTLKFCQIIE